VKLRSSWIGVLMLLTASGCAMLGRGSGSDFGDAEQARELTLHVINDNFYDATIYAVWGTYRKRLGVVTGQREDTFRFRWAPLELSIEIRLLAVGSTTTHSLPVDQGDILELRVQPDLHRRIPPPRLDTADPSG
jgi:hypothetical protein